MFNFCFFPDVIQVEVIRTYTAKQPDELSLQVADVVLVYQHVDGMLCLILSDLRYSSTYVYIFNIVHHNKLQNYPKVFNLF